MTLKREQVPVLLRDALGEGLKDYSVRITSFGTVEGMRVILTLRKGFMRVAQRVALNAVPAKLVEAGAKVHRVEVGRKAMAIDMAYADNPGLMYVGGEKLRSLRVRDLADFAITEMDRCPIILEDRMVAALAQHGASLDEAHETVRFLVDHVLVHRFQTYLDVRTQPSDDVEADPNVLKHTFLVTVAASMRTAGSKALWPMYQLLERAKELGPPAPRPKYARLRMDTRGRVIAERERAIEQAARMRSR